MLIHGLNKLTLIDYPGLIACTVFTGGCNMRCPFCQNGSLVLSPASEPLISEEDFFAFLDKRKNDLEGVVISGGEPTLAPNLYTFIKDIKKLKYRVKLDTNGSNPDIMIKLMEEGLIDYLAMDIKASPTGYEKATGIKNYDLTPIRQSVDYLLKSGKEYEFRTTVVKELHDEKDMVDIASFIKGCTHYYLQSYEDSSAVISKFITPSPYPEGLHGYSKEDMVKFCGLLNENGVPASLRGI